MLDLHHCRHFSCSWTRIPHSIASQRNLMTVFAEAQPINSNTPRNCFLDEPDVLLAPTMICMSPTVTIALPVAELALEKS